MAYKKIIMDEELLIKWIFEFVKDNGFSPRLEDLYVKKGCPYSKETILKKYHNLSKLYEKIGIKRKGFGKDYISDKDVLKELRFYVLKHKTTDRDILRKLGLHDRSVYERRFGSWNKALEKAGITSSTKVLIKYFEDYNGEPPGTFLRKKIGKKNNFTTKQRALICKIKKLDFDTKLISKEISQYDIKKNFRNKSIMIVSALGEPTMTYFSNKSYAIDGHVLDSDKERIIDDFLHTNNIEHEIHGFYPGSAYKYDFKINNTYVEYAGLTVLEDYSKRLDSKKKFIKENKLNTIFLYDTNIDTLNRLRAALQSDL